LRDQFGAIYQFNGIFIYGQMPSAQVVALDRLFGDLDDLDDDRSGMA
jgi:hypothetical protein